MIVQYIPRRNVTPPFTTIKYGILYNYYATTDARKITSSDDWIIPTRDNFITLGTYLGGNAVAGGKLKTTGTVFWNSPNTGATNETNFNGNGSGCRSGDGSFVTLGQNCYYHNGRTDGVNCGMSNGSAALSYSTGTTGSEKAGYAIRFLYAGVGTPTEYIGNDLKKYRVVTIGTQTWLADNLAETKYRDGSSIPEVTSGVSWAALTTGAWSYYNNDSNNM